MPAATPPAPTAHRGRLARNGHHLLLALGCSFVFLLLGFSQWQATSTLQAMGDLRRQAVRVERLDSLLIQVMDAENAVRGYLLSGNRGHLEPYDRNLETINATLEDIRGDLDPNPENDAALADLSGLVAIKLRSLDQAVDRGVAGEEARTQSKRYTDRIRDRVVGMKARLAAAGDVSFEGSTRQFGRTRWTVFILAGGGLALMAVLFGVLKRQLELREQLGGLLQSENQRLDALVQERTAELSDLASYLTNVREAEKSRLARELHDELGSLLTAAKMEAEWIERKLDEADLAPCQERLHRLESLLDSGIALKRRIIDDLRPPLLEELGLISTLRILSEEFTHAAGETQLNLELPAADLSLPAATALALYRIAQEALTNIRQHANAHQVKLALRLTAEWLELHVEDDGTGFQSKWVRGRHHGLAGIKHRVLMCAGELILDSQPGAGTRITVRIPLVTTTADQEGKDC